MTLTISAAEAARWLKERKAKTVAMQGRKVTVARKPTHNALSLDGAGRDSVTLDWPVPPGANRMTEGNAKGQRWTSREYASWKQHASALFAAQGSPRIGPHTYALTILVDQSRTRLDLGNVEKPVSDMLQRLGVIKNDNMARRIETAFCASQDAPEGIRVMLRRVAAETKAESV